MKSKKRYLINQTADNIVEESEKYRNGNKMKKSPILDEEGRY